MRSSSISLIPQIGFDFALFPSDYFIRLPSFVSVFGYTDSLFTYLIQQFCFYRPYAPLAPIGHSPNPKPCHKNLASTHDGKLTLCKQ